MKLFLTFICLIVSAYSKEYLKFLESNHTNEEWDETGDINLTFEQIVTKKQ